MKNHTNTTATEQTSTNEYPQNVLDLLMQSGIITDIENIAGACDTIGMSLTELSNHGADEKELRSVSGAAAMTASSVRALLNRMADIVYPVKVGAA